MNQHKAAEIMNVSQSAFHRILNSAREKIAEALVEGRIIKIKGGGYVIDEKRYRCKICGFEWQSPEKEYEKCPDCQSEDISIAIIDEEIQKPIEQPGIRRISGRREGRIGAGPPRVCKCTQCGHETEKTPGIPCRAAKCPECRATLCGAD